MRKELLQCLSDETGCTYLSDLRFIGEPEKIKAVLSGLDPQDYSLREWNDAIHYLTGEPVSFVSENEAKAYLLRN